jgi:hypothetical protein
MRCAGHWDYFRILIVVQSRRWVVIVDAGRLFAVEDGVETTMKVLDEGVPEIEVVWFGATHSLYEAFEGPSMWMYDKQRSDSHSKICRQDRSVKCQGLHSIAKSA